MRRLLGRVRGRFVLKTRRRGLTPTLVGLEARQLMAIGPLKALASPQILKATGQLVPIVVSGSMPIQVTGKTPTANFFVVDEYRRVEPRGQVVLVQGKTLDAKRHVYLYNFSFTTSVLASRSKNIHDGRHYDITVAASDSDNGQSKTLPVIVPR